MTRGLAPNFQTIGFLKYASPKAFLRFVTKGESHTKARSAGLEGQWLIVSTTLKANPLPNSSGEGRLLVEFLGGVKHSPKAEKRWIEIC